MKYCVHWCILGGYRSHSAKGMER